MKLLRAFTGLCFLTIVSNCKSVSGNRDFDSGLSATSGSSEILFVPGFKSTQEYADFAMDSSGLISGGKSVKFLIDFKGHDAKHRPNQIYFMNSNFTGPCSKTRDPEDACQKYHVNFAMHELDPNIDPNNFNDTTYFENANNPRKDGKKAFAAGTLSSYKLDTKTVYAVQLFPQDTASVSSITEISRIVRDAVKIPDAEVIFLPTGDQQIGNGIKESLANVRVGYMTLDTILGSRKYLPMHAGEAYGFLRLFPKDQEALVATDIVIFDELPLDLSVVSGVITKAFQDSNSHINLKSKERNTPNMVLRDVGPNHEIISQFIDKPVRLVVTKDGFTITPSTAEEVNKRYEQTRASRKIPEIKWERSKTIVSYDAMCPGNPAGCLGFAKIMGSKGANLGFLKEVFKNRSVRGEKLLAYDPVPKGFAVPLQFYDDVVNHPGNAGLKAALQDFIAEENAGRLSNAQRSEKAAAIRQMFLDAEFPAENLKAMTDMMLSVGGTKEVDGQKVPVVDEWKIRSAGNAEDIEHFDGAGLHDSYASRLSKKDKPDHKCKLEVKESDEPGELTKSKVSPKTVACAVKGVYSSLWNKRAIDERSFARIDHSQVAMGLAVVPTYDNEGSVEANSVVVTKIIGGGDLMGISMSIQDNNNTVTNPTPGTFSEVTMAISPSPREEVAISRVRLAKPLANQPARTTGVLSDKDSVFMAELTRKVEEAYCLAKPDYYYNTAKLLPQNRGASIRQVCSWVSYDPKKEKALDMELKVLCKSTPAECAAASQVDRTKLSYEFVVKQVREFAGK